MLCELAHNFPPFVAAFLERELLLKSSRRFREESITDLLTFSLLGLERFGIRVDLPPEVTTGADMDWHFVAPGQKYLGRYARLLIQAKRAKRRITATRDYWYYEHLDHLKGAQAGNLIAAASGPESLPLYAFYHPTSALASEQKGCPAVEGVNFVDASLIEPVVRGGCRRLPHKTLQRWQPFFLPLSDLLCWRIRLSLAPTTSDPTRAGFVIGDAPLDIRDSSAEFHPLRVADRLNARRLLRRETRPDLIGDEPFQPLTPSEDIPDEILRAIRGEATDRAALPRPRVIFSTSAIADEDGDLQAPDRRV